MDLDTFRRRVAEDLSLNSSARRPPAQANMSSVAEVRRLDSVNRSPRRPVEDLRMKRAAKERRCRARRLSRSSSEAARLPQPITARDTNSRKVEERDNQKKRHRQVSNSFVAIIPAAPEREDSGAAF